MQWNRFSQPFESEGNYKKYIKWAVFIVLLGLALMLTSYYVDYLWYHSTGYTNVFIKTILSKVATGAGVFVLVFAILRVNAWLTVKKAKNAPEQERWVLDEETGMTTRMSVPNLVASLLKSRYSGWLITALCVVLAGMISVGLSSQWLLVQQFFHPVEFGAADPLFGNDISFYFFTLPGLKLLYELLLLTLVVCLIFSALVYSASGMLHVSRDNWREVTAGKLHLAILAAGLLLLKAFGYQLDIYNLLYAQHELVFGATYMDAHARLLGYRILMGISLAVGALIVANLFIKRFSWIVYSVGLWVVASFILTGIYPEIIQKLVVQPNEFNCEKPYLENAIAYTQKAYNLDSIEEREFNISYDLTGQDIQENDLSIQNIRLWDWKPLLDTYKSLQELRLYYIFNDVDVDRYTIDGAYRQVMLAAREMEDMQQNEALSPEAKTWINYRLMFTHGYGLAMSQVNEVAEEGFPRFLMKDIPPQFASDLKVTRPEIYFGECTDSYVIVNTKQQEFDYPMGEQNVYTTYEGEKGIQISSLFRRIMLAMELKDYKLLLSGDITAESQLLLNRNIFERVHLLAPYLKLEDDAYIVVGEDGGLYWMIDAYTTSSGFPYAQPFTDLGENYIRNSVKILLNAYTGETNFYIMDENDPIVMSYAQIFPDLYRPVSEMPEDLRKHIRYPEQLFEIQADIYRTYHMTDPWVFYNKEDSWVIANEVVENSEQQYDPYYLVTRLPEEEKEEFIIIMPYTPNSRPNLNAWMCGRMDGEHYGKIVIYQLPKQETVYGPMQIESRIDQNTEISQQLTLWNQGGSTIYRGNLLIIPVKNSLLYVEPLYLQSAKSAMPELKRVIVSYGNTIVMENNLDTALTKIFGEIGTEEEGTAETAAPTVSYGGGSTAELIQQAQSLYDSAQQAVREGNWAAYGNYLEELGKVLNALSVDDSSATEPTETVLEEPAAIETEL